MSSLKTSDKYWSVTEILKATREFLEEKNFDDARVCAETFVMDALKIDKRHELYMMFDSRVSDNEKAIIRDMMKKRVNGEPLQYIIGKTKFYSYDFKIDDRALIPREDTEHVIDAFEKYSNASNDKLKVLDLCTGSGIIGITIKKLFPSINIILSDISEDALSLARENIELNNVKDIKVVESNGLNNIKDNKFDIIVSNPPYVIDSIIDTLDIEVKNWEPHLALKGGDDGLDFFRNTYDDLNSTLKIGGLFIFEYGGFQQTDLLIKMYEKDFKILEIIKDFNNIDRVMVLKKR